MIQTLQANSFVPCQEGIWEGLPAEIYHDHEQAPEISRGIAVSMASYSPAHVYEMIHGKQRKPTKAMVSGTLTDLALLEPDNFKEGLSHWTRPPGLSLTTKEGIQWKNDHPGLPYLQLETDSKTEASVADIRGMIASVMAHPLARRIVKESVKQESAFCFCPTSNLLRKCRPDTRLVDNSGRLILADLKTTYLGGTANGSLSNHIARTNLHVQAAFYSDIYRDLVGEDPFFIFFMVERKPPYVVRVFDIHREGVQSGRDDYRRALDKFSECKANNKWPAYPEEIETIRLPKWALQQPEYENK